MATLCGQIVSCWEVVLHWVERLLYQLGDLALLAWVRCG